MLRSVSFVCLELILLLAFVLFCVCILFASVLCLFALFACVILLVLVVLFVPCAFVWFCCLCMLLVVSARLFVCGNVLLCFRLSCLVMLLVAFCCDV